MSWINSRCDSGFDFGACVTTRADVDTVADLVSAATLWTGWHPAAD